MSITKSYPRVLPIVVQVLIVISVILFSVETLPELNADTYLWINYTQNFLMIIFSIEYLIRVFTAEKKLKYIFSFFGIVDLLSILPFYLQNYSGMQVLRIIRLVRVFKILRFPLLNKALNRLKKALNSCKEELAVFIFIAIIVLYMSAVGIYFFEHSAQPEVFKSIFHSLWWSVATLTTVGYGEIYPITAGGKFFTFIVLMFGLGVISIPTGIVASALLQIKDK